jgi:hypothetical protein
MSLLQSSPAKASGFRLAFFHKASGSFADGHGRETRGHDRAVTHDNSRFVTFPDQGENTVYVNGSFSFQ